MGGESFIESRSAGSEAPVFGTWKYRGRQVLTLDPNKLFSVMTSVLSKSSVTRTEKATPSLEFEGQVLKLNLDLPAQTVTCRIWQAWTSLQEMSQSESCRSLCSALRSSSFLQFLPALLGCRVSGRCSWQPGWACKVKSLIRCL